jgi:hypothetical protein
LGFYGHTKYKYWMGMIKNTLLTFLFCLSVSAQRTPLSINGTVVNNPNFTNTSSTGFTVSGANVSAHDKIWTNSAVQAGAIEPVGGSNLLAPGTFRVIGQFTNDALQASTLPYVTATKALGSITLGTAGQVLTSAGAGVVPTFQDAAGGGDTLWTNDNGTISANSTVADGGTAFSLNSSNTLTSGNLVEVKNNGTNTFTLGRTGDQTEMTVSSASGPFLYGWHDDSDDLQRFDLMAKASNTNFPWLQLYMFPSNPGVSIGADNGVNAGEIEIGVNLSQGPFFYMYGTTSYREVFSAQPSLGPGQTSYKFDTTLSHTSGNLAYFANNATNKVWITFDGNTTAVGGFSSQAPDAAVTIASTGWTNTFGKNAVVYMDSAAGITFTVYNNAVTPIYTNSTTATGVSTVLLQPSGRVIITAGTLGVGRATPF